MSYYPILRAPGCSGRTVLYNFSPNNWEEPNSGKRLINLTWIYKGRWRSEVIDEINEGNAKAITSEDIAHHQYDESIPLLSLSAEPLPASNELLPSNLAATNMPAWRATLGLATEITSTCYQGELDPFPVPGSLLTFPPFIQFGSEIKNFLLFMNLEKSPELRESTIEIFDSAKPERRKASFEVRNNSIAIIPLDGLDISSDVLPAIICKGMSGIPLFFSKTLDGNHLSLEHTHPPASNVIHGHRGGAQKLIKSSWFKKLGYE